MEITGVAGSGKSTVTSALEQADGYQLAEFIHARNPNHLGYMLHSLPRLTPLLVQSLLRKPRMSWADFKLLVYVTEWNRFLARQKDLSSRVILFDQGPVYALVRLKARGLGLTASKPFRRWRTEMLSNWTETLSLVVWLDAPDELLRVRINQRAQSHAMKGEEKEAGQQFMSRYRALFREIIDDLEELGGPELRRFDTRDASSDSVAAEIRSVLSVRLGGTAN